MENKDINISIEAIKDMTIGEIKSLTEEFLR